MEKDLLEDPLLREIPEREGYRVLEPCVLYARLGQGGMGTVYRARHLNLGIDVAVKCLKGSLADEGSSFVVRFQREARIAAGIHHQNLVQVYDVSHKGGVHYLVMEYVRGETARHRVHRKGPLAEPEACRIAVGAATGLGEAHAQRVVHRDVKPDNIMISHDGRVKVSDLGLAKALESEEAHTLTQGVMGTPQYMAPEQWEDSAGVGPASDVWAMGATLYFLLTGKDAIATGTMQQVCRRICAEPFPDVRAASSGVSADVAAILERCVARDPGKRYADCRELAHELKQALAKDNSTLIDPNWEATAILRRPLVSPPPAESMARIRIALDEKLPPTVPVAGGLATPVPAAASPTPAASAAPTASATADPRWWKRAAARWVGALGAVLAVALLAWSLLGGGARDEVAAADRARSAAGGSGGASTERAGAAAPVPTAGEGAPSAALADPEGSRRQTGPAIEPADGDSGAPPASEAEGPASEGPVGRPTSGASHPTEIATGAASGREPAEPVPIPGEPAVQPAAVVPPQPLPPVVLTLDGVPPESEKAITKQTAFVVSGHVEHPRAPEVRIEVDGQPPETADLDEEDRFEASISLDEDRAYEILVLAEGLEARTFSVVRDTLRPELTRVDEPEPTSKGLKADLLVHVNEPVVGVEVGGQRFTELEGGQWSLKGVDLAEGENTFDIVATDPAGNEGTLALTIMRDSQGPALQRVIPPRERQLSPGALQIALEFDEAPSLVALEGVELRLDGRTAVGSVDVPSSGPEWKVTWNAADELGNGSNGELSWEVDLTPKVPPGWEPFGDEGHRRGAGGWAGRVKDPRTGVVFVLVEGGTFVMGSTETLEERPPHDVQVPDAFYLGETEVSRGQWSVMTGKSTPPDDELGLPAVNVSWSEVDAVCRKLGYRLPTEAEWEYACRAGRRTAYGFGQRLTPQLANFADPSSGEPREVHPCGRCPANDWGLRDMHGNVWEWCEDVYDAGFYGRSPAENPLDATGGPEASRVLRGGSCFSYATNCRSASRRGGAPNLRSRDVGFRVACSLP